MIPAAQRREKMLEAARATALAREIAERWNHEDTQAKLKNHANRTDKERGEAKVHRAFADELRAEAVSLTEKAVAIFEELRG